MLVRGGVTTAFRLATPDECCARDAAPSAAGWRLVQELWRAGLTDSGLYRLLRRRAADRQTSAALARAVEARDAYTGGHIERVRRYSLALADRLDLAGDLRQHLEVGAILHDIGKIAVPDAVLGKGGALAPEEWAAMRRHPEIGCRLLAGIAFLGPAVEAVAAHHERYDGTGYPRGLAGAAIPLLGRIVAVTDAYDAMTTDRPYRRALAPAAVHAELVRGRGTHWDPAIVDALLALAPLPPLAPPPVDRGRAA